MAVSVVGNDPVTAPEEERAALRRLVELLGAHDGHGVGILGPGGAPAPMPATALRLLREIAAILARGEGAVIASVDPEVTPIQAADLLALPHAYLEKLLDEGAIPATGTGAARRIKLTDLLAYKQAEDARRREAMVDLVRLSEELGLYDQDIPGPTRRG